MFTKSFKNISFITTIFVLTACGGGGDTSIASPGELGSLDNPTGGGGTGGSSSNVLTGYLYVSYHLFVATILHRNVHLHQSCYC